MSLPFDSLFSSTGLKVKGIRASLLSLGALDFGMVVDGAVVMVENIVRHMSHGGNTYKTPMEGIRHAAHEAQRPGFFPLPLIIPPYPPLSPLQHIQRPFFLPFASP